MRDYTLQEISTGRVLGTARIADDIGPGELVLAFRRDLLRVSEVVEVGVNEVTREVDEISKVGEINVIDEVDKSDEEFEAFLLEILSDFQVSIPEIGTIRAEVPPLVFLTSNNTREMGDALKRRCLHLYVPFPDQKLEERIVEVRVPDIDARLRRQLVTFVQSLRAEDLKKVPSVSETIDWARTLLLLNMRHLEPAMVRDTLNVLLKYEQDIEAAQPKLRELVRKAGESASGHAATA